MYRQRCSLILALVAGAVLGAVEVTRAEVVLLLTTRQVLAVDLADTTVVSRYGLPVEVGASVKGIDAAGSILVVDSAGRRVWSVDDAFGSALPLADLPEVNAEGIAHLSVPVRLPGRRGVADLVVNGQAPMVPPDTLFVMESTTGTVVERFPMPADVSGVKDVAYDGEKIWAVDTSGGGRLWRVDPATGTFETSFALPASPIFAVTWSESRGELWLFQSGIDIVAHAVDRTTGAATEVMRITEDSTTFVLAAAVTDMVTPTDVTSWGALKEHFSR
jgi:hypothetical protein